MLERVTAAIDCAKAAGRIKSNLDIPRVASRLGHAMSERYVNTLLSRLRDDPDTGGNPNQLRALADACGVRFAWLVWGEGAMVAGVATALPPNAAEAMASFSWDGHLDEYDAVEAKLLARYELDGRDRAPAWWLAFIRSELEPTAFEIDVARALGRGPDKPETAPKFLPARVVKRRSTD